MKHDVFVTMGSLLESEEIIHAHILDLIIKICLN